MKIIFFSVFSLINLITLACAETAAIPAPQPIEIKVGIYAPQLIEKSAPFQNGHCPDPYKTEFTNSKLLVDLVILCNALTLGGLEAKFNFQYTPDYLRIIRQAASAQIAMPAISVWKSDVNQEKFYITSPILNAGEFEKGIYTRPDHPALKDKLTPQKIAKLSMVTNANWAHDLAAIKCANFRMITGTTPYSMAKMVAAKRGDFLLLPFFKSPDLAGALGRVKLQPVPGVKIVFNGSQHFIVSKKHPQGKQIYAALEQGVQKLTQDGTIQYLYAKLGFFNTQTKGWENLGCKPSPSP